MPKGSVRLIAKICVKKNSIFAKLLAFAFTLKLTQNYIIVQNNRFKGLGGSVCVVLCPQELEQQCPELGVRPFFSGTGFAQCIFVVPHRIRLIFKKVVAQ